MNEPISNTVRNGEPPRRVLISRLSAVGDCIHTLPVACALKKRYPECRVGWVVQSGAASLLADHPCIDELFVVPRGWLKSPAQLLKLRRGLRAVQFDWAVDPQSLTKSAMAAWLSKATRRVGFCRPQGRELALKLNNILIGKTRPHVVESYLELLRPLGIVRPEVEFRLPVFRQAAAKVRSLIVAAHLTRGYAVINPGAGWPSKVWPAARYAGVARHLGEHWHLPSLVVWAGEQERRDAELIVARSGGHALLAPRTTLPELAELTRPARCFVGSDTGPLHLAAALGVPCVAMYGPTLPDVCGPYGKGHETLQAWYQDGTSRARRKAANDAMRDIEVDDVVSACDRVLRARAAA